MPRTIADDSVERQALQPIMRSIDRIVNEAKTVDDYTFAPQQVNLLRNAVYVLCQMAEVAYWHKWYRSMEKPNITIEESLADWITNGWSEGYNKHFRDKAATDNDLVIDIALYAYTTRDYRGLHKFVGEFTPYN